MEDIERPDLYRHSLFPIDPKYQKVYELYTDQKNAMWFETEIAPDLQKDIAKWREMPDSLKNATKVFVDFFKISDGVTNEVTESAILPRITCREIITLYDFSKMMEDIHNLVYSLLGEKYIAPGQTKEDLFKIYESSPIIRKKIDWLRRSAGIMDNEELRNLPYALKTKLLKVLETSTSPEKNNLVTALSSNKIPLGKLILINAINEGIYFTSSFCFIFWLRSKGMLPGLAKANEFISKDENAHKTAAIYIYNNYIKNKLSEAEVHQIIKEAVDIERDFVEFALKENFSGMNSVLMIEYVEYIADRFLKDLGYGPLFNRTSQPFTFMVMQGSGVVSSDFFSDPTITEYNQGLKVSADEMKIKTSGFGEFGF